MRGRKYIAAVVLTLLFVTVFANFAYATQYVSGYYRSNGTYVQPYYRSNPDGYFYNNYSTYANINPYTGTLGTKRYPSYSSGYTRISRHIAIHIVEVIISHRIVLQIFGTGNINF